MLRTIITKTRRWYGRVVLRQSPVEQWSQLELERRIRKLEQQKQEYKTEMDDAKQEYDSKIGEAKTADETRLPEIKSEASRLLSKYEALRSQWLETLVGLRFMQQAALGKQINTDGPEPLPSNMSPAQFERSAQSIRQKVQNRENRLLEWGTAANQLEDISQGGSSHMDSMADKRVDAAIDAARDGDDVPTLDELADDTFVPSESEPADPTPAGTEPAGEPERF